jgi:FKBP-type peptidyl-prolyl cis-trans isomerase
MLITKQQTAIDTLGQKVEGLTKTLGETQKAVTAVRHDFDALVSLLGGQAPPGAPPAELDMGKLSDEANAAFLTAYANQDGVTKRPSGLMYRVVKEGPAGGKSPTDKSAITIKYQGAFIDGTIFDQAATPVTYPLDQLIPGWIEAVPLMKEGDEWEVVVPYSLGYGEQGRGSIPGKQTLVFKIELVKVES